MITSLFDSSRTVMIHTGCENISLRDVLSATRSWFSHEDFNPQTPVVWNFGEATVDMSIEELRQMYDLVRSAVSSKRTGGRTSWVHSSAMVRAMIDIIREEFDWGSDWKTFETFDAAIEWSLGS